ncbi:NADH-quinone oxidoreductase subunit H [Opitutaceae bacterium EW11]|nr:NADH-quinone oxidoreductase subunit H [Opitutaceae bacterium EW11]
MLLNPAALIVLSGLSLALSLVFARWLSRMWLAGVVAGCVFGALAAAVVLSTGMSVESRGGFSLGGEADHLHLDAVSALFLALLSVVGAAGAIYSRGYWTDAQHPRSARAGRFWWSVLLLSLEYVVIAANGLHFLIAWELFTLSAYFLVTLDRQRAEVRSAGWLYLGASHVGTLCLFAYFSCLAAATGSWDLGPALNRPELAPLFWFALIGFGLKSGMFPLHIWLPSAHANAPSHVSAILSGVTIKMGIYGLVRFTGWYPVPSQAGWVVAALGVASAVLGVAFALGQHDLKRLLAYHSVENIGIILIGFGFALIGIQEGNAAWGQLALAGGLLHVWNHGLFKSLLFLGAGSVLHATRTREMSRLGGLWRSMPWTAALFGLGAAAISGLPPLNGFVSEFLVYLGLFDATISHTTASWASLPATVLLGVTGALALACFVKVCGVVFLGAPRSEAALHAHEAGPAMRGPMLLLAGCCVAIGLAPAAFWPAVARAADAWRPGLVPPAAPAPLFTLGLCHLVLALAALLIAGYLARRAHRYGFARTETWSCGYTAPDARMQYTAGSFASTITEWFDWILRPTRHKEIPEAVLPAHAHFEQHTPETVLDHVVAPAGTLVMHVSTAARRLQHGRVQSYLAYIVAGLALLAALVLIGVG